MLTGMAASAPQSSDGNPQGVRPLVVELYMCFQDELQMYEDGTLEAVLSADSTSIQLEYKCPQYAITPFLTHSLLPAIFASLFGLAIPEGSCWSTYPFALTVPSRFLHTAAAPHPAGKPATRREHFKVLWHIGFSSLLT
ncbi:uncharacterized protein F5147DRAFT_772832 [Suillus discolor]|uniref:Uncharacterized protein n=1 Tax=Suillus discolor TaxID=1912936 RepID=A0A9P7JUP0_9AGAM|nr:uncharacterized protein F5147DRAFT_772832 [Suillus discolor]KAG2109990.1 hypothetical protein F5147DRAFT_772832 [Suillus discolor]